MRYNENNVTSIAVFKKVILYDAKTDTHYLSKKGILWIEFDNMTKNIIDLENMRDITNDVNIEVKLQKKLTKVKKVLRFKESIVEE